MASASLTEASLRLHRGSLPPVPRSLAGSPGRAVRSQVRCPRPCGMGRPSHAQVGGAWTAASPAGLPAWTPTHCRFPGWEGGEGSREGGAACPWPPCSGPPRPQPAWVVVPLPSPGSQARSLLHARASYSADWETENQSCGEGGGRGGPRPAFSWRREQQRLAPQAMDTPKPAGGLHQVLAPKSHWLLLAPRSSRAAWLTRARFPR